jgi:hypothetical protein
MPLYEKIKDWLKQKENKQKLVTGLAFIVVFIVGFGAGSFTKSIRRDTNKSQTNYTTNSVQKPAAPVVTAAPVATSTSATNCVVKGNISSAGKKIYHVQGGAFYNRVKPEQCFNTETEALAAGFIKSSR